MSSSSSSKAPGPAAPAVAPIDVLGNEGKLIKLGKTTKLMIAAAQGSMRSVEKLLRQGARVDVVNDDGHTAMHYAAKERMTTATSSGSCIHKGYQFARQASVTPSIHTLASHPYILRRAQDQQKLSLSWELIQTH